MCEHVDGVWADGGSVRTDGAHFLKSNVKRECLCVWNKYLHFTYTSRWREECQPSHNPRLWWVCADVFVRAREFSAADVYSTLHAGLLYVRWRRKSRFSQLMGANACETRIRLALKSDFISNYILLDDYGRHLCRYEISHPWINFAPE